jgi:cyclomaltodextrinase / maltogenic alpha-amylase / neopullulanase
MNYIGAPAIYYGDEIAMEGQRDPDCRRPFVWDWEKDAERAAMHGWYTKLANLRLAHPALRTGDFRTLSADGMAYAFERSDGKETFVVVLNAGRQVAAVAIDCARWGGKVSAVDELAGGAPQVWSGAATVQVPGSTGRIYRIVR